VISDELPGYFERYGWAFEKRDATLFRTGFVGETSGFDIWVRLTDGFVGFTINPYLPKPEQRPHGAVVFAALLSANHELNLAKFSLDEDGDIALSVEMPAADFGYSQFNDGLTAIAHYADAQRERLLAAAAMEIP
jgi:hypothetical protein